MSVRRSVVALSGCVLLLIAAGAPAGEKKIDRSELPPAVEKTVAAQGPGATVRGLSREEEKGRVLYEAELSIGGRSRDILIDATGAIVEAEEEVSIESLSPEVQAGLKARAGKGAITKVESITKGGRLVGYEAQVDTHGKRSEISVGPEGKPLGRGK